MDSEGMRLRLLPSASENAHPSSAETTRYSILQQGSTIKDLDKKIMMESCIAEPEFT
jgi:hypothetical protein